MTDDGYPPGWPRCACGKPVLDGHLTCGELRCDEAGARMTRDEAAEELWHRYRVRVALSLEHEGRMVVQQGATMTEQLDELPAALVELLEVMVRRARERITDPEGDDA